MTHCSLIQGAGIKPVLVTGLQPDQLHFPHTFEVELLQSEKVLNFTLDSTLKDHTSVLHVIAH